MTDTENKVETQDSQEPRKSNKQEVVKSKVNNQGVTPRSENVNKAVDVLCEKFPKLFSKEGECKPLKIGIVEDIKSRISELDGISVSKVRLALRAYTSKTRYLESVKEGASRYDLDGNAVETITAEHEQYAKERIEEIKAKIKNSPKKPKFNKGKKPFNKGAPFNKGGKFGGPKRSFAPRTVKAKFSDLVPGLEVFVSSSGKLNRGTVVSATASSVKVNLDSGSSVTCLIERVHIKASPSAKTSFNVSSNSESKPRFSIKNNKE